MPVPLKQVVTLKEAYDYAMGSFNTAKCSSAKTYYYKLAEDIKEAVQFDIPQVRWSDNIETGGFPEFQKKILQINAMCIKEIGSVPKVPVTPKTTGSGIPDSVTPPGPQVLKSGFPWWIVLLLGGGALVYYMYNKKKGGVVTAQGKRVSSKQRKKSTSKRKRNYTAVRRSKRRR